MRKFEGSLSKPTNIAVELETNSIFILDEAEHCVKKFKSNGTLTTTIGKQVNANLISSNHQGNLPGEFDFTGDHSMALTKTELIVSHKDQIQCFNLKGEISRQFWTDKSTLSCAADNLELIYTLTLDSIDIYETFGSKMKSLSLSNKLDSVNKQFLHIFTLRTQLLFVLLLAKTETYL